MSLELKKFDPRSTCSIYSVDKKDPSWALTADYKPKASIDFTMSEKDVKKEFKIGDSQTLFPMTVPEDEFNLRYLILGESRSGKSWFIARLADLYLKQNKKSVCVIVRPLEDKAFKILPPKDTLQFTPSELYKINQDIKDSNADGESDLYKRFINTHGRTLFVFDDVENVMTSDKKLIKFIIDFQIAILQLGAKSKFDVCISIHQGKKSGSLLLPVLVGECTHVFATRMSLYTPIYKVLTDKFDVHKKHLERVRAGKDYWMVLCKTNVPPTIVTPSEAFITF
jgi:hypothetical protein